MSTSRIVDDEPVVADERRNRRPPFEDRVPAKEFFRQAVHMERRFRHVFRIYVDMKIGGSDSVEELGAPISTTMRSPVAGSSPVVSASSTISRMIDLSSRADKKGLYLTARSRPRPVSTTKCALRRFSRSGVWVRIVAYFRVMPGRARTLRLLDLWRADTTTITSTARSPSVSKSRARPGRGAESAATFCRKSARSPATSGCTDGLDPPQSRRISLVTSRDRIVSVDASIDDRFREGMRHRAQICRAG